MNSSGGNNAASPADAGSGSAAKRRPGSKLGQMRFMQRAAHKAAATASPAQVPAEQDPARWMVADGGGSDGGCVVITDNAPLPGAMLGHLSFGGFSPAIESLQAGMEAARQAAAAQQAAPANAAGATISDEAMAAALARAQQRVGGGGTAASSIQHPAAPAAAAADTSPAAPTRAGAHAAANGASLPATAAATSGGGTGSGGNRGSSGSAGVGHEDGQLDDGSGILPFGGGIVQQGQQQGAKKKQKKRQQQHAGVAPLRDPKRKKHERGL